MWIYKNQKSKILEFEFGAGDGIIINLDQHLMATEGRELLRKLLIVIQTYKSSGDFEKAQKFYQEYSAVSDEFL